MDVDIGNNGGKVWISEVNDGVVIQDEYEDDVVFDGGDSEDLYETLDEYFGEDRPVDELDFPNNDVDCVGPEEALEMNSSAEELFSMGEDDSDDEGEITECLCGHDPYWEDHGLCPFEDDVSSLEDDGGEDDSGESTCVCGNDDCRNPIQPEECATDDGGVHTPNVNVSLNTTVETMDATSEQRAMYREMASLVEDNYETFVSKNQSYGNSFLNTNVGFTDGGPFDSQLESNANGLLVRMSDKMTRLENLLLSNGEDRVGEKAVETALDLANYSTMLAYLCQQNEGDN